MPAVPVKELIIIVIELVCGVAMGSILGTFLIHATDPIIVFLLIIATIIAILVFAEYLPAFSFAYFAGYIGEFLHPIATVFGGLKIPVLILALVVMGVVILLKMRQRKDRPLL